MITYINLMLAFLTMTLLFKKKKEVLFKFVTSFMEYMAVLQNGHRRHQLKMIWFVLFEILRFMTGTFEVRTLYFRQNNRLVPKC